MTLVPTDPGPDTAALDRLVRIPSVHLGHYPTPVEEMPRLREALGGGPRLLVKRDDAIPFGFGGNKVRKLQYVIADALAAGADTLVTCGAVQSNHARATTAAARRHGLHPVLVCNGTPQPRATANALLDELMGAEVHYVADRRDRTPGMEAQASRLRAEGRRPYVIPLGASTPLGALGYVRAVTELLSQVPAPDVIVHACSSGGTQAGLVAGCALHAVPTRVIGISADDPSGEVSASARRAIAGMGPLLGLDGGAVATGCRIEVHDEYVGEGYGLATPGSVEAQEMAARTEALFVDHTYTAKALGALIDMVRTGAFREDHTILFWHTGGQVGLFA
ncbi:MAG TPA: D-cysteine desulfhydrase family protein [Gemmatimonadales bacterium]|nr:D-cysteine desulfhydrase family protein [Gemmatimonadales bacterium]